MTYYGATAASSLANPPIRIAGGLGGVSSQSTGTGGGRGVWLYNSSVATTEMSAAGYFSDAGALGMQQGDLVLGAIGSGSSVSVFVAVLSSISTAGAANLASTGGIVSSTR